MHTRMNTHTHARMHAQHTRAHAHMHKYIRVHIHLDKVRDLPNCALPAFVLQADHSSTVNRKLSDETNAETA